MAVPQVKIMRKEAIGIELTVTSSCFNSKLRRPSCQSSSTFKFMQSMYQGRKIIRTIAMKILIEKRQREGMLWWWESG